MFHEEVDVFRDIGNMTSLQIAQADMFDRRCIMRSWIGTSLFQGGHCNNGIVVRSGGWGVIGGGVAIILGA